MLPSSLLLKMLLKVCELEFSCWKIDLLFCFDGPYNVFM